MMVVSFKEGDETRETADELLARKQIGAASQRPSKENTLWSHVKISFDNESVKVESEHSGPTTAISAPTVPPSIKIIGKEVSDVITVALHRPRSGL